MKRFEDYWAEEVRWEADQWERYRRRQQRRTREERKRQRITQYLLLVICLLLAIMSATRLIVAKQEPTALPGKTAPVEIIQTAQEEPEDFENAKIEAALLTRGYFREDIPLDYDTQAALLAACEETGVEYELALAVIRKESTYRNIIGDDGDSVGYMQVQERWHRERMERLGVTDLQNPFSNFRVGCDYLAELLGRYPVEDALTAYNTGRPGESRYADTVLRYRAELLA